MMENQNFEIVEKGRSENNLQITFIQVIAAFAVIQLHTNRVFHSFSTEGYWFSANIIESICYFSVNLFFMITGVTLINYQDRYTTKVFFKKRFQKTVIPYVFWTLVGLLFCLYTNRIQIETVNIRYLVNALISCNTIINIYWFFQPLFCIYLVMPLFAAVEKNRKMKVAKYLVIMGLIFNILVPFLSSVWSLELFWPYQISAISQNVYWVWAGYYLFNAELSKTSKLIIYILSLGGVLMITIGTYTLSMRAGEIQNTFKGNYNLPCVLYSFGIFILLKDLGSLIEKNRMISNIILMLGKYTFSAYLLHWFLLRIIDDLFKINIRSMYYRVLSPYLIYLTVILITIVIRKIPLLRRTLP